MTNHARYSYRRDGDLRRYTLFSRSPHEEKLESPARDLMDTLGEWTLPDVLITTDQVATQRRLIGRCPKRTTAELLGA